MQIEYKLNNLYITNKGLCEYKGVLSNVRQWKIVLGFESSNDNLRYWEN